MEERDALEKLMHELEIDFEDMETESKENDPFEEDIEHEFLDKILQELEYEEITWSPGRMLEDKTVDECIKTSSCTGNCTGMCVNNVSDVVPPSTLDQGQGKTGKDNVQLSPEVSECIIDIHCAGDWLGRERQDILSMILKNSHLGRIYIPLLTQDTTSNSQVLQNG